MPELSLQHIDQISRDISREEISFSHLLEDLIDHVCCDVEYEMQRGMDFHEAYKKVKKKMGPGRLKEIQQETLYSVDTNYRNMKNLVKISGVAGTIMFGLAWRRTDDEPWCSVPCLYFPSFSSECALEGDSQ